MNFSVCFTFGYIASFTSFSFSSESKWIFLGRYSHSKYYCDYEGMILRSNICENHLTYFMPLISFYNSRKYQKNGGFNMTRIYELN